MEFNPRQVTPLKVVSKPTVVQHHNLYMDTKHSFIGKKLSYAAQTNNSIRVNDWKSVDPKTDQIPALPNKETPESNNFYPHMTIKKSNPRDTFTQNRLSYNLTRSKMPSITRKPSVDKEGSLNKVNLPR